MPGRKLHPLLPNIPPPKEEKVQKSFTDLPRKVRDRKYAYLTNPSRRTDHRRIDHNNMMLFTRLNRRTNQRMKGYRHDNKPEEEYPIQLCNRQIHREFGEHINKFIQTRQIHYSFAFIAAQTRSSGNTFRWVQLPTLQPNIDTMKIDYIVEAYDRRGENLTNAQRRDEVFSKDDFRPLFDNLEEFIRLFERTLKHRHGNSFRQVHIRELHINFIVKFEWKIDDWRTRVILPCTKPALYRRLKEDFLGALLTPLYTVPKVTRESLLLLKSTIEKLRLT